MKLRKAVGDDHHNLTELLCFCSESRMKQSGLIWFVSPAAGLPVDSTFDSKERRTVFRQIVSANHGAFAAI
jgi:hypothetical protein